MGFGWGTVLGMLADRFPNRKESLRNKAGKIKKEMDEITKKKANARTLARYNKLADKLYKIEQRLKNS